MKVSNTAGKIFAGTVLALMLAVFVPVKEAMAQTYGNCKYTGDPRDSCVYSVYGNMYTATECFPGYNEVNPCPGVPPPWES